MTLLASLILTAGLAATQTAPATSPAAAGIPPGESGAKQAIESTTRHAEYAAVAVPGGTTPVNTYVVFPERKDKAPVVIVIQEIFGLTDWIKGVADTLAADGFIAVAPDLLSGKGPGGGGTEAFEGRDAVIQAVRALPKEEVAARLDAVRAYATKLPASSGRSATIGFCWGGAVSFLYAATATPPLDAAVVYYGSSPDAEKLASLKTPVLGLYGADDARVNTTIEPARAAIAAVKGSYETEIYEGAGHGFLRGQQERDGANLRAAEKAWPRTIEFLKKYLEK
ncbi:MAG: dienelactone hydrolase family protein [Candidatus Polarisedimenticolia bacterium]